MCGGYIQRWDAQTLAPVGPLLKTHDTDEHRRTVVVGGVAYSPDGKTFASVTVSETIGIQQGILRCWETATGRHLRDIIDETQGFTSFAYTPTGDQWVVGGSKGGLQRWGVKTGCPVGSPAACYPMPPPPPPDPSPSIFASSAHGYYRHIAVTALSYDPNGLVLTLSADGRMGRWRAEPGPKPAQGTEIEF